MMVMIMMMMMVMVMMMMMMMMMKMMTMALMKKHNSDGNAHNKISEETSEQYEALIESQSA